MDTISAVTATRRFLDVLRDQIGEGKWRYGSALPKITFFMKEYGVSNHTITNALRMLEEQSIIHKQGKSWIVGARRSASSGIRWGSEHRPVIAILQKNGQSWANLLRSERSGVFATMFQNEASRQNVLLQPILASKDTGFAGVYPEERDQAVKVLKGLGARYKGALINGSLADISSFAEWCEELASLGRPVAWFDQYEQLMPQVYGKARMMRCHVSEENAIHRALKSLSEVGHRDAAYLSIRPSYWSSRRLELLAQNAQQYNMDVWTPGIEHISDPQSWVDWYRSMLDNFKVSSLPRGVYAALERFSDLENRIRRALELIDDPHRMPGTRDLREVFKCPGESYDPHLPAALTLYSPLIIEVLSRRPTAIIIGNDNQARFLYYWLRLAGVNIPAQISLVSFDNGPDISNVPVSTIDFGFADLGYRTFHYLLGDLPVKGHRAGNMPAIAELVERGSIAEPRRS